MNIQITAEENAPTEALVELSKAAVLQTLIKQHLGFEGNTDDKWWLQSSVKYYLESGKVSGSFHEAIKKIAEEYLETLNISK